MYLKEILMEMLTWKNVLDQLLTMTNCELADHATVHVEGLDEFYPVHGIGVSKDGDAADGTLDHGHIYLEIDG